MLRAACLLGTAPNSASKPSSIQKTRVLFQPEAALLNGTSDTCEGGRAGTPIPDFLTLNLKGEMLKYVFVLAVMGAPWSKRHLTICSFSCSP